MHSFKLLNTDNKARAGVLRTPHGEVKTPIFMPVGTRASVKALTQEQLEELDADIILGNTYHLMLRPGMEVISQCGGDLHNFMNWKKPILTDSGGFQIFSLKGLRKITDDGVEFRSHIDGKKYFMTPEVSMEIQKTLGSDIVMAFDECPPLPGSDKEIKLAIERTLKWAKRCSEVSLREGQQLFGIIQGGLSLKMRKECMEELLSIKDFPGLALGGLSVGEEGEERDAFCHEFVPMMPSDRPRYLMGVGTPLDILEGIASGIDMFDCVLPSRNARNGQALTSEGPLNIKNAKFKFDSDPLDPNCACKVCKRYSRAYIRHLVTVGEFSAHTLMTYHNIHFYLQLTKTARKMILANEFDLFYKEFKTNFTKDTWR